MITNTVSKWRMAKDVAKAHMARYIGVDRSYMTKLENGQLQPSGEMMFRIAEYLEKPVELLFQHVPDAGTPAFLTLKCCLKGKTISRPDSAESRNQQNSEIEKG